jgi:hypothetical protein
MPLEPLLVSLDNSPWGPIYRMTIGFMTLPVLSRLWGQDDRGWALVPFLFVILLMLRVIPIVVRRLIPLSDTARAIWAERRQMAKRYDSYQWQKLFWIGIGLALYTVLSYQFSTSRIVVSSICLLVGAFGLARWRTIAPRLESSAVSAKVDRKFGWITE